MVILSTENHFLDKGNFMTIKQLSAQELEMINTTAQTAIGVGHDISKVPPQVFVENPRISMHIHDLNDLVNGYLFLYDKVLKDSGTVQQQNRNTTIN